MTVYLESNFVLEIALGQEQAAPARAILGLGRQQRIELVIPAFALSEPYSKIGYLAEERRRLAISLDSQIQQLSRSIRNKRLVAGGRATSRSLLELRKREADSLQRVVTVLASKGRIIALTPQILAAAAN